MDVGFWTPDKVRDLRSGIDQGLTATKIAERLGTTKNTVIGKCLRSNLKLQFRVMQESKREVREIGLADFKWARYSRPRKEDFLPYDGPTSMERLDAYHRTMDLIPGAKPFKWVYGGLTTAERIP